MISEKPIPKASELNKTLPTHQYVMDWDPDFPESVVKERKIPSRLITNYSPVFVLTQLFNPKRILRMLITKYSLGDTNILLSLEKELFNQHN